LTRIGGSDVRIDLVPATREQQPILANLLQLYMHDFSEFLSIAIDGDGEFHYPHLSLYWSERGRIPFLAVVDGEWAGFALIRQETLPTGGKPFWDMAEFFVLRGYRRHGIGMRLAHLAFGRFPGAWQVRVMESNTGACQFWQRAVEGFTGASHLSERTQINGAGWRVFRFESGC
jgi:predicted acetyltransferase